jgi:hypothetical protein
MKGACDFCRSALDKDEPWLAMEMRDVSSHCRGVMPMHTTSCEGVLISVQEGKPWWNI